MVELEVPKRVVLALLVLTILVSFIGTLTVLQFYTGAPAGPDSGTDAANIAIRLLPPNAPAKVAVLPTDSDSATLSVRINKYGG